MKRNVNGVSDEPHPNVSRRYLLKEATRVNNLSPNKGVREMRSFIKFSLVVLLSIGSVTFGKALKVTHKTAMDSGITNVVLAVHAGLGIPKAEMTPAIEKRYREDVEKALKAGYAVYTKKGSSLDIVEAAVNILEDAPEFNAGKGAVFTHDGRNELDASIMSGKALSAGAVAEVTTVKNPISLARLVMEKSPHVFLVGMGAEQFATEMGIPKVDPSYFKTDQRLKEWQEMLKQEAKPGERKSALPPYHTWGTVGAVALDGKGDLAAATSTGGMTNKRYGRVGDSPVIGAGTYAENGVAAISCTGHGEYFIRYAVAHDIVSLMKYKGLTVNDAADEVLMNKLKKAGGEGGAIALDSHGRIAMPYNSEAMTRGYITKDGQAHVFLYEK